MTNKRLWPGLLLFLTLSTVAPAGEGIHIYVASRAYDVSVAPVDEESKDAESSVLYQRTSPEAEWENLGPCRREVSPAGAVRFTREVDVERDGIYYYTSRPVVGGEVDRPPLADERPQAIVVVDTLPPTAEIIEPAEEFRTRPGERIQVSWVVSDENLDEKPAALAYSGDGGKSWNVIRTELPPEGALEWIAPQDLTGPAVIRLAAVDKAGNAGRALRSVESMRPPRMAEPAPKAPEIVPEEDTGLARRGDEAEEKLHDPNRSWLYYLMALNLMRQNKPADALQYYWLSVQADPDFINAWADIALAYNELGAYKTARDVVEQARGKAPDRIDLLHLMGETFHAEGMDLLGRARTAEERLKAKGSIDQAVAWYGRALDKAAKEWKLAEQAASFYRLGEVCYYVNMDKDGARAYWEKILALHVPTPNPDLLQWSTTRNKSFERRRYERNTDQWVALHTWQNWARGYLNQMDERERAGILDMMAAQRINRAGPASSLSYAGNEMNPGREDGRSLFSLPGQLGSPDDVAACVGVAGESPYRTGTGIGGANDVNLPAHINRPPLTEGYSFYAGDERKATATGRRQPRRQADAGGLFTGRPEPRPQEVADPYAFPQGRAPQAGWNGAGPYGSQPISSW